MMQRDVLSTCRLAVLLASLLGLSGCLLAADPSGGGGGQGADAGGDDDDDSQGGDCTEWRVGTLTGYDNSNLADDPNAGSIMEFSGLTDEFYDGVPIAAIDSSDWDQDKYHWIDVTFAGTTGRVGAWDACRNEDCPDGTACCTENKERFDVPGYLLDLETRTAERLFGVSDAENTLNDRIEYRICGAFDPDAIASQYGVYR